MRAAEARAARRVAVADDNRLHLALCVDALRGGGFDVLGVADFRDPESVVHRLAEWHPDLVVVDERLSGSTVSGLWLLEQLRRVLPEPTKYLLCSAYTDDAELLRHYEALGVPARAVLPKASVLPAEIVTAVRRALQEPQVT